MKWKRNLLAIAVALAWSSAIAGVSVPNYMFTQAGIYPGAALTNANGDNLTQIAGYYFPPSSASHGYVQTGASFITAEPPNSSSSYLWGINTSGLAAGGFCQGSSCDSAPFGAQGYTYDSTTGAITAIDFPGSMSTVAYGVSALGVVVGGFCPTNTLCPLNLFYIASHGFIDDNGTFTQLDYPGSDGTTAFGVNNTETVVGTYSTFGGNGVIHGFLYQNGAYTDLNFPGANWTEATGINNSGVVVGYYQDSQGGVFGFMYYNGQWAQINARSGGTTNIFGINDHNDLVGTWSGPNGHNPAIKGVPTQSIPILQNEAQ